MDLFEKDKEVDLFSLEQKILHDIAEAFPYSFTECQAVYQKCLTFDKTIRVLDFCQKNEVDSPIVIKIMDAVGNWQ